MKLKPITFREALVVLSEGGKIHLDPTEHKNHEPIFLNEKGGFQNIGYMELVDFPDFNWYVEDDGEMDKKETGMKDFIDLKEFTLYDQAGNQYDFKENENGEMDAYVGKGERRHIIRTVTKEKLTEDIALGLLLNKSLRYGSLSEWMKGEFE